MSAAPRICLDLRPGQKASRLAGTGVYAIRLAMALQERCRGQEFRFLVLRGYPLPWPIDPAQLIPVARPRKPEALQEAFDPIDIRRLMIRHGVSLLHSMVPGLVAPSPELGVVVTVLDLIPDLIPEDFRVSAIARWLYRRKIRCATRASHIITPSEASRRDLERCYGVSGRRITAVHLGTQFPSGNHDSARSGSPRRWPRPYLLYLGGFSHRKNVATVLHAFAKLTEAFPQVDLLLAGSPPPEERRTLLRIARDLNLGERIVWLGYVAADDLPGLYAWSEGFVYPSLYEGFGLPVLEAMQFGAPVISTGRGSIPEVMGDIGLAVDPESPAQVADAMAAILSNPDLLRRLRRDGQRRASEFSWGRCAEETAAVYAQVLAQRVDGRTGTPT